MKRRVSAPLTEEEKEEKETAKEAAADSKRFELIVRMSRKNGTNSLTHGIWDTREATVVFVSHSRDDAAAELARLKGGK